MYTQVKVVYWHDPKLSRKIGIEHESLHPVSHLHELQEAILSFEGFQYMVSKGEDNEGNHFIFLFIDNGFFRSR